MSVLVRLRGVLVWMYVFAIVGCGDNGAESPSTDSGPLTDAGLLPTDAGLPSADSGLLIDAGLPPTDAGLPSADSGSSTDAGLPPTDASPSTDAEPMDSGAPPEHCARNQQVVEASCVMCPSGTVNEAGDDPRGPNTSCDPVICPADQHVISNTCVDCPASSTNAAGDDASGDDTPCDPILCMTNERVQSNTCVSCPTNSVRVAGDPATGPDTRCSCIADHAVFESQCVACDSSSFRAAGDPVPGPDTVCMRTVCGDGVVSGSEVCDDYNALDCGTCNATCTADIEPSAAQGLVDCGGVNVLPIADGSTLVLDDGAGAIAVFEFDDRSPCGGPPGVAPGNTPIGILNCAPPPVEVCQAINDAINLHGPLRISATPAGTLVNLTHDSVGTRGNQMIVTTAGGLFTVGMAGGLAADCETATGCGVAADCRQFSCNATNRCE